MYDRLPLYPGRVKLIPVEGQENVFDMVRADSPKQDGTALNKANLLKDETAADYGLTEDAVPDEVFQKLSGSIGLTETESSAYQIQNMNGEDVSEQVYSALSSFIPAPDSWTVLQQIDTSTSGSETYPKVELSGGYRKFVIVGYCNGYFTTLALQGSASISGSWTGFKNNGSNSYNGSSSGNAFANNGVYVTLIDATSITNFGKFVCEITDLGDGEWAANTVANSKLKQTGVSWVQSVFYTSTDPATITFYGGSASSYGLSNPNMIATVYGIK